MLKDLIPLQNSNAFQTGSGSERSDWVIRENETNKVLFTLPKTISDKDMFEVRKFAKKHELNALNAGIQYQKAQQDTNLKQQVDELREALKESLEHGNKLALKLAVILEEKNEGFGHGNSTIN